MRDFVVCCHAGFVDNTPIVDLNYAEECSNCADMPVAIMPNSGGGGDEAVAMDAEGEGEGSAEQNSAAPPPRGDSIVMMQLDRRLPLEHFESLGTPLFAPTSPSNSPAFDDQVLGALAELLPAAVSVPQWVSLRMGRGRFTRCSRRR